MVTVAIPFAPMPRDQNPNVKVRGRDNIEDVYLRAAFVAFASVRRWNPDYSLVFVTSSTPHKDWVLQFESLGVEIQLIPFDHLPPAGFAEKFLGALFLLDAVAQISADYLLLIDPDVLCVKGLDDLVNDPYAILALKMDFDSHEPINGITLAEATEIHKELGLKVERPIHYGGELYGIPEKLVPPLRARVDQAWTATLQRWENGSKYYSTEEHVMSFALLGMPLREASAEAKRIWTSHSYRTVDGSEGGLSLWHLPAEKERGFVSLYGAASNRDSWFWNASHDEFVRRAGALCGLHSRGPIRLVKDVLGSAKRVLAS
jgi:hypothetical protein